MRTLSKPLSINMKHAFFILISIFSMAAVWAQPTSWDNIYIKGFGGVNFINDSIGEGSRFTVNPGFFVGGAAGYRISKYFRAEMEAAYRQNQFGELTIQVKEPLIKSLP